MIKAIYDKKWKFQSFFEPETGNYLRTGILDAEGRDTGIDPFMASFPQLLDIGIMQTCVCANRCQVDCYQKAICRTGSNMSVENYEKIMQQCENKMFQCALGGAGDVDTHEDFEKIIALTRQYGIIPSFTTSGIAMDKSKAKICKGCGAVAVSEHFADYTNKAIDTLLNAGIKTNIHYVLSNKTIDKAIEMLSHNSFHKGINAVVFLLYKPIGLGKEENVLSATDERVADFFKIVGNGKLSHKVGFDSCSCAGIVNFTNNIAMESIDFCEGGRFSAYIDANMNMMPCSFANQNPAWFVNLNEHSIEEAWNSETFEKFRMSLKHSCCTCKDRALCGGGCPLVNQITLCNRKERSFMSFM